MYLLVSVGYPLGVVFAAGTPIRSIMETEDRQAFAASVETIGERVAPSACAQTVPEVSAPAVSFGEHALKRFHSMGRLLLNPKIFR